MAVSRLGSFRINAIIEKMKNITVASENRLNDPSMISILISPNSEGIVARALQQISAINDATMAEARDNGAKIGDATSCFCWRSAELGES